MTAPILAPLVTIQSKSPIIMTKEISASDARYKFPTWILTLIAGPGLEWLTLLHTQKKSMRNSRAALYRTDAKN